MQDLLPELPGDESALRRTRLIDEICDAFEAETRAHPSDAPLARYLDRVPEKDRRLLLTELIAIAMERLTESGAGNPLERLLDQNEGLREEIEQVARAESDAAATIVYESPQHDARGAAITPRRKRSRGLRLRCPHCNNHVELIADAQLDEIDCVSCGSQFSIVDRTRETRMATALEKIDRFELVARLGIGGFGTVWKARDTELDRAVAVKIPRYGQLTPAETEQFLREARSAAQLSHPSIVPVHEVGREGDAVFIVSDLVRGVPLSDWLTGKQPTPQAAAETCRVIAEALEHAHGRGVVHRDLKPSNVMIDEQERPLLMDFGLAKREAEEVTMTTEGQIIGTPAYMSPEQAGGQSAWADRRSDIYSLGVILFEMLTGELPFRGNAQMQVHQRQVDDAPNARELNRHLPLDLSTIVAKCLERTPGSRYQTAKEVAEELTRFLSNQPIRARPVSRLQRLVRWVQRNPAKAVIVALVSLMAICGTSAAWLIASQRDRLARKNTENESLIVQMSAEKQSDSAEISKLRGRLDVWEGRGAPWRFWPPHQASPPHKTTLRALAPRLKTTLQQNLRSKTLNKRDTVYCHLALAALAGADSEGELSYRMAAELLEAVSRESPGDLPAVHALAWVYTRLARLTTTEKSLSADYLRRSQKLFAQLERSPRYRDQAAVAEIDSRLRRAVSVGYNQGGKEELQEVEKLLGRFEGRSPTSPAALYRLVAELTGGDPSLLREPTTDEVKEQVD